MPILGINNRTENWKTAYEFAPFFRNCDALGRLARKLGEPKEISGGDVHIELFWRGMRDYVNENRLGRAEDLFRPKFKTAYENLFPDLRKDICEFTREAPKNQFQTLKDKNYHAADASGEKGLYYNLRNTEIDIVLETPDTLFIGEAKQESNLRGRSDLVLVHQLIRQFVMARILLHLMESSKIVVPFLVVDKDKVESVKRTGQVRFMMDKYSLREDNVLIWDDIRGLHP